MNLFCETNHKSLNKFGEELCGDKVEIVKNADGTTIVLADGLGSGVKANILASLTSKIVSTMLVGGADVSDVVETIASTLPVCKDRQLAYSTFTVLRVNPKGVGYIMEFDNPELIILRRGMSLALPRQKTVIEGKTIYETYIDLEPEDVCVLMSDGVIHAGVGQLLNLGWQHKNVVQYLQDNYKKHINAQTVTHLLLSACNDLYAEMPGDDTTVAVCRLRTPNIAYVMVGPPIDRSLDSQLVDELINFDGIKVVCGGTTSQIVSRQTGRKLEASIKYIQKDVPPIATIDGIDLVTEGVVTLGKTLKIIKENRENLSAFKLKANEQNDGAMLLANVFIEKCTGVKFVVGKSLNPAHQNVDLPFDLSIKLRIIHEIAACLKEMDKKVDIVFN